MNNKFAVAQSPITTRRPELIPNLIEHPTGDLFNSAITKNNYVPYFVTSQELNHAFMPKTKINEIVLNSVNTNKPHPLARYSSPGNYVQGYYDPTFESTENDRLQFRATMSQAIISSEKDRYKYPLLGVSDSDDEDSKEMIINDDEYNKRGVINDKTFLQQVGDLFAKPETPSANKIRHQKYGTISSTEVPLYPEIYPYISRTSPNEGWSNNDKSRLPAGSYFTSKNQESSSKILTNLEYLDNKLSAETFNITFKNNEPTVILTPEETKEFEKIIYPEGDKYSQYKSQDYSQPNSQDYSQPNSQGYLQSYSQPNSQSYPQDYSQPNSQSYPQNKTKDGFSPKRHVVHVDVKRGNKEGFENPIEKDADYMYLQALKIRASAVCDFLNNHASYRNWTSNWKLLEKNLKRNGLLFERLDDTDADIAYVINKGDEVKFRIRDEKRYVPLNIYQYVLYHEMAHMSTTELQHTPKFHELLNIISLAGFELGFIDLTRTTKEFYTTNGQPILCRASMKEEISYGCDWLKKANPKSALYYESIKKAVNRL